MQQKDHLKSLSIVTLYPVPSRSICRSFSLWNPTSSTLSHRYLTPQGGRERAGKSLLLTSNYRRLPGRQHPVPCSKSHLRTKREKESEREREIDRVFVRIRYALGGSSGDKKSERARERGRVIRTVSIVSTQWMKIFSSCLSNDCI